MAAPKEEPLTPRERFVAWMLVLFVFFILPMSVTWIERLTP